MFNGTQIYPGNNVLMLAYNNSPHTTTGETPATLLMGFQPRLPSSFLIPEDTLNVKAEERVEALNARSVRSGGNTCPTLLSLSLLHKVNNVYTGAWDFEKGSVAFTPPLNYSPL